ncbi:MAG: PDR/VanB family oxidoreductase [Orrella sp.]
MAADTPIDLLVRTIRLEAQNILSFELVHPGGEDLPIVEAGAHVDVHLPGGLVRSYSLAGDPQDRKRWVLGVLRETNGTGGSRAMHERVRVGGTLRVGAPRNEFALAPNVTHSILLAGGIGVTPIKAMAHALSQSGASFELHYCARSPANVAFVDELKTVVPTDRLHFHFDGGDPARGLDINALLAEPAPGTHVYYCGPGGFMAACETASAHWPQDSVHREYFKAPTRSPEVAREDGSFTLHLVKSGQTLTVEPDQTIVRAIELSGGRVPTSCMSGLCGTCKVSYLDGEVDHRDFILSDDEKQVCLTACVSRAKGTSLSLDL